MRAVQSQSNIGDFTQSSSRLVKGNTKASKLTHTLFSPVSTHLNLTPSSSRQTTSVCGELEETNSGLVGLEHHPGLQNIVQYGSLSERNPRICGEQGDLHITGDSVTPGQRCNNLSTISSQEFFLHNFHSSQKGWRTPSHNKLERLEQVYPPYPFQDGGYTIPEGYHSSGGFHDQIRPQGCLFFNPYTPFPSEVFEFQVKAQGLPVHLSSFWSLQCSSHIHKSNELKPVITYLRSLGI